MSELFSSICFFFFFKQKTAYEMRIRYWSSDVCSSDLVSCLFARGLVRLLLLRPLVLGHRVVLQDLALEDPDLDATGSVSRLGCRRAVVDVRAERMERHPALAIPLAARDFGAAEAPAAVDPNALRAEAHRRLDRALHGAPESDAAHELLGDVLRDELGVDRTEEQTSEL